MTEPQPTVTLSLTGEQHDRLQSLLLPSDGREAVAIALCGRRAGQHKHRLLVREIHPIPPDAYSQRTALSVTWSTDAIAPLLDKAEEQKLSVIKIHSHPNGYKHFSELDNTSDHDLLPAVRGWVEADIPHGSCVLLPDGQMFGRTLWRGDTFTPISCISVVGPDIHFWHHLESSSQLPEFTASHAQTFGQGTTNLLRHLSVAVVGCSGTGSPVIEQLARLGVGKLVLVDDDIVEDRNVNRILNSTIQDAHEKRPKVDVLAEAINRMGLGTSVLALQKDLWEREVVQAVAECDVIFGCVDTVSGRYLLNTLATYYTIPYFDLGVRLEAVDDGTGTGQIREVCGTIHYLQPGRSSLMSRGLVSIEQASSERLQRTNPTAYTQQLNDGYIRGVQENKPAVISVNMFTASLAMNDFLARLHPYREHPNHEIAYIEYSLSSLDIFSEPEGETCSLLQDKVGMGDIEPLLGVMDLAKSWSL